MAQDRSTTRRSSPGMQMVNVAAAPARGSAAMRNGTGDPWPAAKIDDAATSQRHFFLRSSASDAIVVDAGVQRSALDDARGARESARASCGEADDDLTLPLGAPASSAPHRRAPPQLVAHLA